MRPNTIALFTIGDRMRFLEELHRQDRGEAAKDVEIVPLDDVADRRRRDDPAQVAGLQAGSGV